MGLSRLTSCPVLAFSLLAGCGAQSAIQSLAAMPQGLHDRSSVVPEVKNQPLVYVSDFGSSIVSIYTWSGKFVRTLTGLEQPAGLCSDVAGDVYVDDIYRHTIYEFAPGGIEPVKALNDFGELPDSCAIDAKSGDLAVINQNGHDDSGSVSIYRHARGKPKVYAGGANLTSAYFGGYDDKGNLLVDGYNGQTNRGVLAMLPAGAASLLSVSLDKRLVFPGGVEWDGTHFAVADAYESVIYQVQVSGSKAKVVSSTPLRGSSEVYQFAIADGDVVVANEEPSDVGDVMVWKYPRGGDPTRQYGELYAPFGLAVSAPRN